jgi:hypothetical protein
MASFRILSVPFRPTLPPMPAIGLTISPNRMICHGQDLQRGAITVFHKGQLLHWNAGV